MAIRAQSRHYARRSGRRAPRAEFGTALLVTAAILTLLTVVLLLVTAVPATPVTSPRGGGLVDPSTQPVSFEQGYDSPVATAAPVGVLP